MANAILFIAYIRSTFITDQTEVIGNSQNGKLLDDFLDTPKRSQAPKHTFWYQNMKILEIRFQILKNLNNMKPVHMVHVHEVSLLNGL